MSNLKSVKRIHSTNAISDASEATPSQERLSKYMEYCKGDSKKAIRLYRWNTAIGSAFYGPLQTLEITLRENINSVLTAQFEENWYDNPELELDVWANKRIEECKKRVQRRHSLVNPTTILWELSFGFWVKLVDSGGDREAPLPKSDYELTLWRPVIRKAFPYNQLLKRQEIYGQLNGLRRLRNHIAHHEPIFQRGLKSDYHTILRILGWMSPQAEQWVTDSSRVFEVLKQRHATHIIKF